MEKLKVRPRGADKAAVRAGHGFRAWLAEHGYSPRTIQLYTQTLRRASEFLAERGTTLARATEDDLHEFQQTVPNSRSSRAGVKYALVAYYKFRGRKDGGPAAELPLMPTPYRKPRPVSVNTYLALIAAARDMKGAHQVVGEMLAYTGCRIGELRRAAWHQFDFTAEPPVWHVEGKAARRRGRKPRQLVLVPSLAETLLRWRGHTNSDYLFPSPRDRRAPLGDAALREYVAQICEHADVPYVTPHRWRHTVATLALKESGNLRAVQEFLGHASSASTEIYTEVDPTMIGALVEALPDPGAQAR